MGRLADIFSHPVAQNLITQGANIAGQIYLNSLYSPKISADERMIQRLDEMIKELDEKLKQIGKQELEQKPLERKPAPEASFGASAGTSATPVENADRNADTDMNLDDHPNVGSEREKDVSSACLPCTRAHLVTVAGTLKEAVRFARGEGGMKDKEVQDRLDAALEELSVMERFDLAPEKLRQVPDNERKAIETVLPHIRKLRQSLAKGVRKLEELEELAAEAAEVYKRAREVSTEAGEQDIDWEQVKREITEEEKDQKGGE